MHACMLYGAYGGHTILLHWPHLDQLLRLFQSACLQNYTRHSCDGGCTKVKEKYKYYYLCCTVQGSAVGRCVVTPVSIIYYHANNS